MIGRGAGLWLERCGLFLGAAGLLAAGCVPIPKYSAYRSPFGDFACSVPSGWTSVLDGPGRDYYRVAFAGPFDPSFYRGVPNFSVRWYRIGVPNRLPNGSYEMYSSYQDFMEQMRRDVYAPDGFYKAGADRDLARALNAGADLPDFERIKTKRSRLEAVYFVAYHGAPAPRGEKDGVVSDAAGRRIIAERHAYAIVPVRGGFYVLSYPATRDGFEKFRPEFFELINSLRLLRAGPA